MVGVLLDDGAHPVVAEQVVFLFFFFSSRRRHTRFKCDWSSDVCSSDLCVGVVRNGWHNCPSSSASRPGPVSRTERSEERRVGKECRSRWSPDHSKKKRGRDVSADWPTSKSVPDSIDGAWELFQWNIGAVLKLKQKTAPGGFFFSSRRRHTRFKCDWSSDVCSSD